MFIQHPKAAAGHPQPDVPAKMFRLWFKQPGEVGSQQKKISSVRHAFCAVLKSATGAVFRRDIVSCPKFFPAIEA